MKYKLGQLILKVDYETKTEVLGAIESINVEDNTYIVEWFDQRGLTQQSLPEHHIDVFVDFLDTFHTAWYESYRLERYNGKSRQKKVNT